MLVAPARLIFLRAEALRKTLLNQSGFYWQLIPQISFLVSPEVLRWEFYCQLMRDKQLILKGWNR
jgi:hypothetical protein